MSSVLDSNLEIWAGVECTLNRVGTYEPGVFDLRSPQPRPTAIAKMIRELSQGSKPELMPTLDDAISRYLCERK